MPNFTVIANEKQNSSIPFLCLPAKCMYARKNSIFMHIWHDDVNQAGPSQAATPHQLGRISRLFPAAGRPTYRDSLTTSDFSRKFPMIRVFFVFFHLGQGMKINVMFFVILFIDYLHAVLVKQKLHFCL